MNETVVTLQGWLGGDVTLREAGDDPGGQLPGGLHPAALPAQDRQLGRRRHPVVHRQRLARPGRATATRSLRRGDPVVVHGRLSAHVWTNTAGIEVTSFEVEAAFVGHDLNRGTSAFTAAAAAPAERGRPCRRRCRRRGDAAVDDAGRGGAPDGGRAGRPAGSGAPRIGRRAAPRRLAGHG